jgi:hypothetical protein
MIITIIASKNKMAIRLDDNAGTPAGRGSVTDQGRYGGVDKEDFFQQIQYNRSPPTQFLD